MITDFNKFMIGIPLIDNQHKEYIKLVNTFILECGNPHKKSEIKKSLDAVVAYAVEHFDAEEYLMRSTNYPFYEEHRSKHNIFRDKIDEFLSEFDTTEINISNYVCKLSSYLVDWFEAQVLDDDVKLAKFLNKK